MNHIADSSKPDDEDAHRVTLVGISRNGYRPSNQAVLHGNGPFARSLCHQYLTVIVRSNTPTAAPPSVRRRAGIKSGDRLDFKVSGRVITILPNLPESDDKYTPAQRKAIDRGIAESEREYAQGKSYGPFGTAAEALASLDANLRRRACAKKIISTVR